MEWDLHFKKEQTKQFFAMQTVRFECIGHLTSECLFVCVLG